MLLACDRDQSLTDAFCGCNDLRMAGQFSLRLTDLLLNFLAGILFERGCQLLYQGPKGRIAPTGQIFLCVTQSDLHVQWEHPAQGRRNGHFGIVTAEDDVFVVCESLGIAVEVGLGLEPIW